MGSDESRGSRGRRSLLTRSCIPLRHRPPPSPRYQHQNSHPPSPSPSPHHSTSPSPPSTSATPAPAPLPSPPPARALHPSTRVVSPLQRQQANRPRCPHWCSSTRRPPAQVHRAPSFRLERGEGRRGYQLREGRVRGWGSGLGSGGGSRTLAACESSARSWHWRLVGALE